MINQSTDLIPDSMKLHAFCDESGNTGRNFLDANHPLYILGTWLIPDDALTDFSNHVLKFKNKYCPQLQEIKSNRIFRNTQRVKGVLNLFKELSKLSFPMYVVSEKKFLLTALITETYLDSQHNPKITHQFQIDYNSRQKIANDLYNHISNETIELFAEAFRFPNVSKIDRAYLLLKNEISTRISPQLESLFLGCNNSAEAIFNELGHKLESNKEYDSPNIACLSTLFLMIQDLNKRSFGLINEIQITYDRDLHYEERYRYIFDYLSNVPNYAQHLFNPSGIMFSSLKNITKFEMADSSQDHKIQAADLLSGAISYALNSIHTFTPAEQELAEYIWSILIVPGALDQSIPRLAFSVTSDKWFKEKNKKIMNPQN